MKRTEYEIIPETAAERDSVSALKSAINNYTHGWHSIIFAISGRGMMADAPANDLAHIRELLEAVEVDEFGRDGNGLSVAGIDGALSALREISGF